MMVGLDEEEDLPPSPLLVAYARVGTEATEYLTGEAARRRDVALPEVDRVARDHLRQYPQRGRWEVMRIDGGRYYVRRGGSVTSSLLISTTTMNSVHEGVESEEAYVAVPERGTLIAAAEASLLGPVAERMWREARQNGDGDGDGGGGGVREPLSPEVFRLRAGKPVGVVGRAGALDEAVEAVEEVAAGACLAFLLVASVDGNIGEIEVEVFLDNARRIAEDEAWSRPTRRVYEHVHANAQPLLARWQEVAQQPAGEVVQWVKVSLEIADRAWGQAAAADLGRATEEMTRAVARASGGGLLRLGPGVGRREQAMLDLLRPVLSNTRAG